MCPSAVLRPFGDVFFCAVPGGKADASKPGFFEYARLTRIDHTALAQDRTGGIIDHVVEERAINPERALARWRAGEHHHGRGSGGGFGALLLDLDDGTMHDLSDRD